MGVPNLLDNVQVRHGGGGDVQAGTAIISFKAYEKGREKWQGPTVDGVWWDEEPPRHLYRGSDAHEQRPARSVGMITFTRCSA